MKNIHGGVIFLVKLKPSACNFIKSNTPPIAQSVSYNLDDDGLTAHVLILSTHSYLDQNAMKKSWSKCFSRLFAISQKMF